jgi:hypothetical protein
MPLIPIRPKDLRHASEINDDDVVILDQNASGLGYCTVAELAVKLAILAGTLGPALFGSGSPEGAVVGTPGWLYVDTDDNGLWHKRTGDGTNTGWVELFGS